MATPLPHGPCSCTMFLYCWEKMGYPKLHRQWIERKSVHGAEIRDVLPAVPAGAGVGTAGVEAFTAGDVPLAAARGGGLACAHLPRAAQGTAETASASAGEDPGYPARIPAGQAVQ